MELIQIKTHSRRTLQDVFAEGGEIAAEFAGPDLVAAPSQQRLPGGAELLHAAQRGFGREHVALLVAGEKRGAGEKRLGVRVAAKFAALKALAAPLRQKLPLFVQDLHAAVALVGDIHPAVTADRDSAGHVELAILGAERTPLAQRFARGVEDRDLVPFSRAIEL
jgi:hypothetical protein